MTPRDILMATDGKIENNAPSITGQGRFAYKPAYIAFVLSCENSQSDLLAEIYSDANDDLAARAVLARHLRSGCKLAQAFVTAGLANREVWAYQLLADEIEHAVAFIIGDAVSTDMAAVRDAAFASAILHLARPASPGGHPRLVVFILAAARNAAKLMALRAVPPADLAGPDRGRWMAQCFADVSRRAVELGKCFVLDLRDLGADIRSLSYPDRLAIAAACAGIAESDEALVRAAVLRCYKLLYAVRNQIPFDRF